MTKKSMRTAMRKFKKKVLGELLKEIPKSFWSYARELQGKFSIVDSLFDKDGKLVTENIDKANTLNSHFESVYTTDDTEFNLDIHVLTNRRKKSLYIVSFQSFSYPI